MTATIAKNVMAYDTETMPGGMATDGLDLHRGARMFAWSQCTVEGETTVCRMDGPRARRLVNKKKLTELFRRTAADFVPVMHNAKFDLTATEYSVGHIVYDRPFHDTVLMSHILRNDRRHRLAELAYQIFGYPMEDKSAMKKLSGGRGYHTIPEYLFRPYQMADAERCMLLMHDFWPQIKSSRQWTEIYNMELELIRTTIPMEKRGVLLDIKACLQMIAQLRIATENVLGEFEQVAGYRFNPRKPAHLHWLLFQHLGLPSIKKTPTGLECTDKFVISDWIEQHTAPASRERHLLQNIQRFRSWASGIKTIERYLSLADSAGVLHPGINTVGYRENPESGGEGVSTGRESSSNPNLQNVSKSAALLKPFPIPARRLFRPRPGYVNLHIDYAGIELRLLVHYSHDAVFTKCLQEGGDPHDLAAQVFFGDTYKDIRDPVKKKLYRNAAKNMNFAIPYGGRGEVVARGLGMDKQSGWEAFERYRKAFGGIVGLNPKVMRAVREMGFVTTAFGRRLYVPRSQAYIGTNYLIQGTAAGILKRAQNRVAAYIKNMDVHLLLPIHDEIVLEYSRKLLSCTAEVVGNIVEVMTDFDRFNIPLEVEVEMAVNNWEEKKSFDYLGNPHAE